MTQRQITPPTALAVDLGLAKQNMRIDGTDMDALVTSWIEGVTAALEHEIGQCILEQTWQVQLEAFPAAHPWHFGQPVPRHRCEAIKLPHPVMNITSVTYVDTDGAQQTLPPSAYKLNVKRYESTLTPAAGTRWPVTLREEGAVTVEVVCGYGTDNTATPANVRLYIIAKLVEQFDPALMTQRDQTSDTVHSKFIEGLLDRCRSYA